MNNDLMTNSNIQINKDQLTLVSFPICPFVQRSAITLIMKKIPFERISIDLSNPPEWFEQLVPTKKVPVLFFNNDMLFESSIINEFIDENFGPLLQIKTPWEKAKERAWICLVDDLIMVQYSMLLATNKNEFDTQKDIFMGKLQIIANEAGTDYFRNKSFGLLDAAIAPVFTRLLLTPSVFQELKTIKTAPSQLFSWLDNLVSLQAVKDSVADNFDSEFIAYFRKADSYIVE